MALDARQLAFDVLERVAAGSYADHSLDAAFRRSRDLDPRDRALATELVYGVLRQQNRLDFALAGLSKTPLNKLEVRVLLLLRLGAYQVLELDRIPAPIAVHETVALCRRIKLSRATGLVNAILRRLTREAGQITWPDFVSDPVGSLTWTESLPPWLARRWHAELGEEALLLARALRQPAPFTLRVNTLKTSREDYLTQLAAAGHLAERTRFSAEGVLMRKRGPAGLPGDAEGLYQVQDEASMLIAHLLAPRPGEKLLDACAAPGGKTTHLAALARNRADILAVDLHPNRLHFIEGGARRLGCLGIRPRAWDMTLPPDFLDPASLDGVLVDAPCSGLGVLRRNPEARWRLQEKDIAELADRQQKILKQAGRLVRKGGRLVYSVCTLSTEETDRVVASFLAENPDFRRVSLLCLLPENCSELLDSDGSLRTWPQRQGMDGFFAVRLERDGS
jgi:16S rRNA (cytosine967-C5)-methyltransferase